MKQAVILAALAVALVLLVADPAVAQGVGLNASGQGQQLIQWIIQYICIPLLSVAVIIAGCLLIGGHHTLLGIAAMAGGALVIANYQTIVAFFPMGG